LRVGGGILRGAGAKRPMPLTPRSRCRAAAGIGSKTPEPCAVLGGMTPLSRART